MNYVILFFAALAVGVIGAVAIAPSIFSALDVAESNGDDDESKD